MSLSLAELSDSIKQLESSVTRWNASDNPRIEWRGRSTKCLSESLSEAFQVLFDVVATKNVDQDARKLALKVDALREAMDEWALNSSAVPEETDPGGSSEMWIAYEMLIKTLRERRRAKPESIIALDQQNLSDRQIALNYFWKDGNGEPDIERVKRERDKPGSEYDPETWINPFDQQEMDKTNAAWANRVPQSPQLTEQSSEQYAAPESIFQLLSQGVSSAQIMRMKPNSTIDGIKNVAIAHSLRMDGVLYDKTASSVQNEGFQIDQSANGTSQQGQDGNQQPPTQQSPSTITPDLYDNDPEKQSYLISGVVELQQEGRSPEQIVAAMAEDFPLLQESHVVLIMQQAASTASAGL